MAIETYNYTFKITINNTKSRIFTKIKDLPSNVCHDLVAHLPFQMCTLYWIYISKQVCVS